MYPLFFVCLLFWHMASPLAVAQGKHLFILSGQSNMVGHRPQEAFLPAVEKALESLARRARREGTAIGIGHAKATTLAVFQRMLPELESRGIEFITAEEAVR